MCNYNKFHNSIINIPSLGQTGFFLTNSVIVTCAHGAEGSDLEIGSTLEIISFCRIIYVTIDLMDFDIDVLLAHMSESINLKLCELSSNVHAFDKLYSFGYTKMCNGGEPCTVEVEGLSRSPFLLKLKGGAVIPGMSGSPLLNIKNGCIVGMIKSSRTIQNKSTPTGGRAIPISTIKEAYDNCYGTMSSDPTTVCVEDLETIYCICEAAYATASPLAMSSDLIAHLKENNRFSALINRQDIARRNAIKTWFSINPFCLRFIVAQDLEGKHRLGITCVLPLTTKGYESYRNGEIEEFKLNEDYLMGRNETDKGMCNHLCIQSFAFSSKYPRNGKRLLRESFATQILKLANSCSDIHIIAEIGTEQGRKMAEYFKMNMLNMLSFDKRPLYEMILLPSDILDIEK